MIHFFESRFLDESEVIHSGGIYEFVWVSGLIALVLDRDVFCKHSMWISTCTFLGVCPRPPAQPRVTIVTQMTLVTLF